MPVPAGGISTSNLYTSLTTVKAALGKITENDKDDLIEQAIAAASRFIDRRTGRRFYADLSATPRTFPITGQSLYEGADQLLLIDDVSSLQDLTVAIQASLSIPASWTTVQLWEPGPDNALVYGQPITQIRSSAGWLPFYGRVQVTARWGWPTVPDEITQATQLLAARLYRRKDSPEGVLGSSEWGAVRVSRIDPDVQGLIAPFVIPGFA